jgi:imidazolonepropionase-like amidohydrolase
MPEQHPRVLSEGVTAFSAVRLFDGTRTRDDHAVLVKGDHVLEVVPREKVPEGISHYHESDCTILPGLIDVHVHFMRYQGPQFLAYGVTTVRDTGNDLPWILARREEWASKPWPRILCLGPILDGPAPVHAQVCRKCVDEADAVAAVGETAKAGVDGLKFYVGLDPAWIQAMVEAGHTAGRKVSMHCAGGGVLSAARAGVDEFFHYDGILADLYPDRPRAWLSAWGRPDFAETLDRQRSVADGIRESNITATPTLAYWDSQRRIREAGWPESEDLRYTPSDMVAWQAVPPDEKLRDEWRRALEAAQRFTGLLLEREVAVLAGSDVPCGIIPPGLSLWRELSLLVGAGMSPERAIRAATFDAASYLGKPELGRLSPGSVADLVFVRGNPLEAIPSTPEVVMTLHNGALYRSTELLAKEEVSLEDEPWARQFKQHSEGQKAR